jgi:hypothetical protein
MREALRAQNLARSCALLVEFRREFDREWLAMSEAERALSELPRESLAFLEWARAMAATARQQAADESRSLRAGRPYLHARRSVAPRRGYCV